MISRRPLVVFDTECYKNYWLLKFKHVESGKRKTFEIYNDIENSESSKLDKDAVLKILKQYCVVSFNGNGYDIPMIGYALSGATAEQLKAMSDAIIVGKLKPWELRDAGFDVKNLNNILDHVDLMEVAPGQASLKLYAARVNSIHLQDLPIEPSAFITKGNRADLRIYCDKDLDDTQDILQELTPRLALRVELGKEYGLDLRSKSDAQIAEAVMRAELEKITGERIKKPSHNYPPFAFKAPHFISFKTEQMKNALHHIHNETFYVVKGEVELPESLADMPIKIGDSVYRMGIGGLHSSESSVTHMADDDYVLIDRDVASYYPMIILICGLFPKHLGEVFLKVYRGIVERRLRAKFMAKRAKDNGEDPSSWELLAEVLKIVINGSFGKFGSKWSTFFSPDLLIQTTLTGQLSLLMLIEELELNGISVVSANTDGIVMKCHKSKVSDLNFIIENWEYKTGFSTEETQYSALYSRDVNNYIAIKTNGEVKTKGIFSKPGLAKNLTGSVCVDAVIGYLKDRTPLDVTIKNCKDIRRFFYVKMVAGGAVAYTEDVLPKTTTLTFKREKLVENGWVEVEKNKFSRPLDCSYEIREAYEHLRFEKEHGTHKYLGKVVRWYYSTENSPPLRYKTNNNKVSDSDNAKPMMDLVEGIPDDLDYERYRDIAEKMLVDIGFKPKPKVELTERQKQLALRRRIREFYEILEADL